MKKVVFAAVLLACSSSFASAQTSFGAGVVYTDLDPLGLGFQVNAYVAAPTLAPRLRIGGDFTYYLPEKESESFMGEQFEAELSMFEINGNVLYDLVAQQAMSVYGLAGLNVSRASASFSITGLGSESESETKIGLNVGGGAQFNVGFGAIYGEAKYVVASDDWGRVVFGAGVRIVR
jgi:opacity protein-like surface antigen